MNLTNVIVKSAPNSPFTWLTALTMLWIGWTGYSLTSYPAPYSDEAWVSSISANLLNSGRFDVPLFGDYGFYRDYRPFHLYNLALAGIFRVFGIGLLQARGLSALGALAGGWLLFFVGHQLYNSRVGLLSAALYLFSVRVLWLGHVARPDTWANAAGIASVLGFIYCLRQFRPSWVALSVGLLTAAIVDIYLPAALFSIAASLSALYEFRERARWRTLLAFTAGGLLGALYWVAVRIDLSGEVAQGRWLYDSYLGSGAERSLANQILAVPGLIRSGFIGYSRIGMVESLFMVGGVVALLARRRSDDDVLLRLLLFEGLAFVVVNQGNHHIIYLMPLLCLAMAAAAQAIGERAAPLLPGRRWPSWLVAVGLLAPLLAGYVIGGLYLGWQNRFIAYKDYSHQIRALIPTQASVLGEATWWFALHDYAYTADDYFFLAEKELFPPGSDVEESLHRFLRERSIDVILLDESLSFSTLEVYRQDVYAALGDYATQQCQLAGEVEGYGYGVERGGPAIRRTRVYVCPGGTG